MKDGVQWEMSHAANAVIAFVAFCSLTISLPGCRSEHLTPLIPA